MFYVIYIVNIFFISKMALNPKSIVVMMHIIIPSKAGIKPSVSANIFGNTVIATLKKSIKRMLANTDRAISNFLFSSFANHQRNK